MKIEVTDRSYWLLTIDTAIDKFKARCAKEHQEYLKRYFDSSWFTRVIILGCSKPSIDVDYYYPCSALWHLESFKKLLTTQGTGVIIMRGDDLLYVQELSETK